MNKETVPVVTIEQEILTLKEYFNSSPLEEDTPQLISRILQNQEQIVSSLSTIEKIVFDKFTAYEQGISFFDKSTKELVRHIQHSNTEKKNFATIQSFVKRSEKKHAVFISQLQKIKDMNKIAYSSLKSLSSNYTLQNRLIKKLLKQI